MQNARKVGKASSAEAPLLMYFYCCLMVFLDQAREKIQACGENWLFPPAGKGIHYKGAAQQQKHTG